MKSQLMDCCVKWNATILEALRSLEKSGAEIVLVNNDEGKLEGVLTDGDIRRGLLKSAFLDSPIQPFVRRDYTTVSAAAGRAEVLDLMQARVIEQIPVVNAEGRIAGLHLMRELIGAVERPNWAVIMAGGRGTRLYPLTEHVPKPMITVAGRPILERLILHLVGFGIRRIFLAINYLGHVIEKHFGNGANYGCEIEYLREKESLGTGGALALLPEQPEHSLLVLNGDVVTQADIGALLDFHAQGKYAATLGVRQYTHMVPFGCVEMSGGRIVQFDEKPVLARMINTGIYAIEPALLSRIRHGQEFPITLLFDECLSRGEALGAFEIESDWIDVGQREQLKIAREGSA